MESLSKSISTDLSTAFRFHEGSKSANDNLTMLIRAIAPSKLSAKFAIAEIALKICSQLVSNAMTFRFLPSSVNDLLVLIDLSLSTGGVLIGRNLNSSLARCPGAPIRRPPKS